jgi:hypothetical protein
MRALLGISLLGILMGAAALKAGPITIWTEGDAGQGDAGGTINSANITIGSGGPLTDILGNLTDITAGADMYEISITDPEAFSAITEGTTFFGTKAIDNPAIYLFNAKGDGLFGNDNISNKNSQAELPVGIASALAPGLYYILIVPSGNLPQNVNGDDIFGDLTNTKKVADGSSTPLKVRGYGLSSLEPSPADTGKGYDIVLTGAAFAETPEPANVLLMGGGLALLGIWKRLRAS